MVLSYLHVILITLHQLMCTYLLSLFPKIFFYIYVRNLSLWKLINMKSFGSLYLPQFLKSQTKTV